MNGEPESPQPVPEIARGPLWTVLLIPPLLTLGLNVLMGFLGTGFGAWLVVPLVVFGLTFSLVLQFTNIVGVRYRESSLVFLSFSYFFGQIIVCAALWIGSCLLFSP